MNIKNIPAALEKLIAAPKNVHIKKVNGLRTMVPLEDFPHTNLVSTRKDEQYDIEFYGVPEGIHALAFDEKTGKKIWAPVKGWSIHNGKAIEIVTLHNNKTIITDDDPRAIYGIAKDATDLTPKRFTPEEALKHQVFVPQLLTSTEEVVKDLKDCASYYFDWNTGLCHKSDEPKIEGHMLSDVDFNFGQFLGIFAGDGWWDKKDYSEGGSRFHHWANAEKQINIADNEGENAAFVKEYLTKLCPNEVKVARHEFSVERYAGRFGDTVRYSFAGKDTGAIATCLDFLLGGKRDEDTSGSANKQMPSWLIGAPIEARFGFLCGMLSTDGSISLHKHKEDAKRKPQLLVNISSTSLSLISGLSSLCLSVGIPCTISFSKTTCGYNQAWLLNLSTPYVKANEDFMLGMASKRKFAVLQAAEVIEASASKSHVRVVMPDIVADLLLKWVGTGVTSSKIIPTNDPGLEGLSKRRTGLYADIHHRKKDGFITPKMAANIVQYAIHETMFRMMRFDQLKAEVEKLVIDPSERPTFEKLQYDIICQCLDDLFPKALAEHPFATVKQQLRDTLYVVKRLKYYTRVLIDRLKAFVDEFKVDLGLYGDPLYKQWVASIVNGSFSWAKVTEVQKTGKVETLYDLTVPGYETFVNADGVVLSNTINIHVPASDAAVAEAKNLLMPSHDPFSDRDTDKVVLLPKQEQILGLYTAATSQNPDTFTFDTEDQALTAIKHGDVPLSANVQIRGGVKMASQKENEEVMQVKGPVRDPKTGKWLPTQNKNGVAVPAEGEVEKKGI